MHFCDLIFHWNLPHYLVFSICLSFHNLYLLLITMGFNVAKYYFTYIFKKSYWFQNLIIIKYNSYTFSSKVLLPQNFIIIVIIKYWVNQYLIIYCFLIYKSIIKNYYIISYVFFMKSKGFENWLNFVMGNNNFIYLYCYNYLQC